MSGVLTHQRHVEVIEARRLFALLRRLRWIRKQLLKGQRCVLCGKLAGKGHSRVYMAYRSGHVAHVECTARITAREYRVLAGALQRKGGTP